MSKEYVVEAEWITKAGLRAAVIRSERAFGQHRCGYVGVLKDSPLYGIGYHNQTDLITRAHTKDLVIGKLGVLTAITAFVGGDNDGAEIRRSLDLLIQVHGGLTYSSHKEESDYPVPSEQPTWWFGYDCNHVDDTPENCPLEYCIAECEEMARQLKELVE